MINLATSDLIRLITSAAADIDVYASFVDLDGTTVTPGRQLSPGIVTATTTTIVAAPLAGVRNVKNVIISNVHASASTQVIVELFDGTNATELFAVTLLPGENLTRVENGDWHHHDAQGAEYSYSVPPFVTPGYSGVIAETIPRNLCPEVNTTVATSGTLFLQMIYLQAGQLINTIDLWSATTAPVTPTNYNVGIYDINRNLLAQSTNKTTEAWTANTQKSFALTAAFRVPVSGWYYIGYYMTAATMATLKGGTARTAVQLAGAAPAVSGTSSTGLTNALPNPAGAITATTSSIYAAVR